MFERVLVSGIVESGVYAIMLDESTDLTAHKHLSICVRYLKEGNPVTKFLKNLPIKVGKAHAIVSEVIVCLSSMLGLDTGKMVSLGTDGAYNRCWCPVKGNMFTIYGTKPLHSTYAQPQSKKIIHWRNLSLGMVPFITS